MGEDEGQAEMTDEEITKLCAQAMESPPDIPGASVIWNVSVTYEGEERKVSAAVSQFYDPLHNDAQAMALAKRFGLLLDPQQDGQDFAIDPGWEVSHVSFPDALFINSDLNRAICECVASMQRKKNKNRLQPGTS